MKRLNFAASVWLVVALIFMVGGCISSTGTGESLVLKTSIQYGTMKYLGKHPGQVAGAGRLVDEIAGVAG
jgi:hypothetical protein